MPNHCQNFKLLLDKVHEKDDDLSIARVPKNAHIKAKSDGFDQGRQLGKMITLATPPTRRADLDGDGLSNAEEFARFRTDFLNPDSDADGIFDDVESRTDSDGDGIVDFDEINGIEVHTFDPAKNALGTRRIVTDPQKADSDGDGLNDATEAVAGVALLGANRQDQSHGGGHRRGWASRQI